MRTLALLTLAAFAATAQKRPVTHEDIFLLKRTGEPAVSPGGKLVVFSVTEPAYDVAQQSSDLWIAPTDGSSTPRRLTYSKSAESSPAWSPDSAKLAFVAKREGDDVAQIYILNVSGGEAQRATSSKTAVANPKWSPDGKLLLWETSVKPSSNTKSTARVYDAMPIRFWNAWLDHGKPRIFVGAPGDEKPRDVLQGAKLIESPGFAGLNSGLSSDSTLQPIWSPDGKQIVFTAVTNRHEMMKAETESHLFRVNLSGGEPERISPTGASYARPKFSPDGKTLYAVGQRNSNAQQVFYLNRLGRIDWPSLENGKILTANFDRGVGGYSIAPDSQSILFDAEDDGFSKLFSVSAAGGAVTPFFKEVKEGGYGSPQFAGSRVIAVYSASTQPSEVAEVTPSGHKLISNFNAEKLAALDMPKPEHFWFTAKNGKRIHSVLFLPPALDKSKKYPLLVFPHGGPNSMSGDSFSTRWNNHLLTSQGYAMIETNYTGSTGFGEKFADDIERDVLRGPAREILEAVDEARRLYAWIDGDKQCALGASYGGYLMNWLNGHTKQFKCIVNHAGAVNNESQYGVNDGGLSRELRMGGPVWQTGKGQWMDQSPFRYAAEWQTPSLITQGELDFRVPVGESITTFKLLQRQGVPARLIVFPDEGHWILKPENNRHHMQEVLAWLKKFLG
ncbi:MAG: S9 family peptidase [Acidobacteria bacterium]|nr:S9 family peptidase [Acidobacteriota bacterium]